MTQFASVAGVRLAYEVVGAGDPPLVFVHGWCCDRSHFAPQIRHFSVSHAVAAVDLRGHGESDRPAPGPGAYDIAVLADGVLAVAEAAGLGEPVLVGHSLGALVGLVCAARPGALRALVMVDPAPITNEPAKAFFRDSVDAVRADRDGSWRTAFVNGMFLPTDAVRRHAIIEAVPATAPGIAADLLRAMGEFDGAAVLGRATVPVLSIGSAGPANSAADLRQACPAITIGQTVGSGHFIQLEVPDQVNAMIERFQMITGLAARP